MKNFQQRVIDEKAYLDKRIEKLDDFMLFCAEFIDSESDEQKLLQEQLTYMRGYADILAKRIANFKQKILPDNY